MRSVTDAEQDSSLAEPRLLDGRGHAWRRLIPRVWRRPELELDSELERLFDGGEGGGADAHGGYIDGVVAGAFGDGGGCD